MNSYSIEIYRELRNEGFSAIAAIFYARKWIKR